VLDDRALAAALRRALEPEVREPSPARIAALQREVRRQRLQRPLRRAAVAAAAAMFALMAATLAFRADSQNEQRSADAVEIANTRTAIEQVRFAIEAGNLVRIEQTADALETQLSRLEPVEMAVVDDDAKVVLAQAHRALGEPSSVSTSTAPTSSSTTTSTSTTSTSTSTSTTTTVPETPPTTVPETPPTTLDTPVTTPEP
jgi:hypothetical protein